MHLIGKFYFNYRNLKIFKGNLFLIHITIIYKYLLNYIIITSAK